MLNTHRFVAAYREHEIYQRLPGFEFTPTVLAKIASYLVKAPNGQISVFAFLYSLLLEATGQPLDEERLLAEVVDVIQRSIEAGRLGTVDYTYEYRNGKFVPVDQPRWWIPMWP